MRTRLVFATALVLGTANAGCFDILSDPGSFRQADTGAGGTSGTAGTGGTGGATSSGGTGGMTTTAPPDCIPSGTSSPVDDTCGIFVSASKGDDTTGIGTKEKPVATLAKAITLATAKPIYMCAETFMGPIKLDDSALIYGALDCAADWSYIGATQATVIAAAADEIPFHIGKNVNVEMYDMNIRALDATVKGGSSIALLAEGNASVEMVKCTLEAGAGMPGADADDMAGMATAGKMGANGKDACTADQVFTASPPSTECGDVDSIGGPGGAGMANSAGPGGPGDPGGDVNNNAGGGEGAINNCGNGKEGTVGANGPTGVGATAIGALSADKGFIGVEGQDGQPGKPGQGGGGGGAAKGGSGGAGSGLCLSSASAGGASGGTGGSGGCGGAAGKGGGGGGASIAIVSLGASFTFAEVTLKVKDGGRGGNGGAGQLGGTGAAGGASGKAGAANGNLNDACKGGLGGNGGAGGKGGGGLGGHSLGVAFTGTAPAMEGATITLGEPGKGGTGADATGDGAAGVAVNLQAF